MAALHMHVCEDSLRLRYLVFGEILYLLDLNKYLRLKSQERLRLPAKTLEREKFSFIFMREN